LRCGARALDAFLLYFVGMVVAMSTFWWWLPRTPSFVVVYLAGGVAAVPGFAVMTALCGASPGKVVAGLRVVSAGRARPPFRKCLVREAALVFDFLFYGLAGYRWGDRLARTVVMYVGKARPAERARLIGGICAGLFVFAAVLIALSLTGELSFHQQHPDWLELLFKTRQ
jgi:uncharacterized RDD family membrane protein YckC